jgi:hypothetical protein
VSLFVGNAPRVLKSAATVSDLLSRFLICSLSQFPPRHLWGQRTWASHRACAAQPLERSDPEGQTFISPVRRTVRAARG